jgi:hypothetical protein
MYELKKIGKVFTSKFVGTGPSSYKKRIYRTAVSQRLRNTAIEHYFQEETNLLEGKPGPVALAPANQICSGRNHVSGSRGE